MDKLISIYKSMKLKSNESEHMDERPKKEEGHHKQRHNTHTQAHQTQKRVSNQYALSTDLIIKLQFTKRGITPQSAK